MLASAAVPVAPPPSLANPQKQVCCTQEQWTKYLSPKLGIREWTIERSEMGAVMTW